MIIGHITFNLQDFRAKIDPHFYEDFSKKLRVEN